MSQQSAQPDLTGDSDASPTRLRGRWLLLVRVAWVVVALLAVGVFVASPDTSSKGQQTD